MDLTPIYELRNRLRTAMIAGTNLISEDFRLKRAAEDIKPLETLSPVFAKIGQLIDNLLAESCEERESALIDTITLIDALLCTQGQVTVSGEVCPIEATSIGSVVTNAPYSVVKTLVEALTTSGNGHYQFVIDTHKQQPELFKDYRIKSAMVSALGAGYAELAEQIEVWLKSEGEEIIPLLQNGFDPKGKKEMVRRVRVMEAVAGAKCNDFYLKMLPDAQRDVKNELIYALRYEMSNVDELLELAKKEKGNAKECAYYALAYIEDERSEKFFMEMYEKKPIDAMIYIRMSTTKWASKMVGENLVKFLKFCKEPDYGKGDKVFALNELELLRMMIEALPGKTGPEICMAYRTAYEVEEIYGTPGKGEKVHVWQMHIVRPMGLSLHYRGVRLGRFNQAIANSLELSVRLTMDADLCALAEEFCKNELYLPALYTAKMLGKEDWTKWLKGQNGEYLVNALKGLYFDEIKHSYILQTYVKDEANDTINIHEQPVMQDIEGKLADYIMELSSVDADKELIKFMNRKNPELCKKLEAYLYKRAMVADYEDCVAYWDGLKKCGCEKCDGLFVEFLKKTTANGGLEYWQVGSYMVRLPGNAESFEKETQAAYEMICDGKLKIRGWSSSLYMNIVNDSIKDRMR